MGTGQLSRSIPHQDLRTYYSYVNGERRESGEWVYVVDSNALLDDVFATLRLKRRLEQGRPEDTPGELPDTVVGRDRKSVV